jgi:hypothetical protein
MRFHETPFIAEGVSLAPSHAVPPPVHAQAHEAAGTCIAAISDAAE